MPWLAVERFQYENVRERAAVLQLLGTLDDELGVPAGAMLVVQNDAYSGAYAPVASTVSCSRESSRHGSPSGLLWQVSFAVSLEVVEYPHAVFSLTANGRLPVALPAPTLRSVEPVWATAGVRLSGAGVRRHLVALAAGLAVAVASGSAVGVAAASTLKHAAPNQNAMIKPVTLGSSGLPQSPPGDTTKARRRANGRRTPSTGSTLTKTEVTSNTGAGVALLPPVRLRPKTSGVSGHNPAPSAQCNPPLQPATPAVTAEPENCVSTGPNHRVGSGKNAHHHHRHHHHHHKSSHPNAPGTLEEGTHQDHPVPGVHAGNGTHHHHSGPKVHHHPSDTTHGPSSHRHNPTTGGSAVAPPAAPTSPPLPPGPAPAFAPQLITPTAPSATVGPDEMRATAAWLGVGSGGPARLNLDPFTIATLSESSLLPPGNQPPAFLIPMYKAAAKRYHVPWQILAAINWIETDYGANLNTSSAGAIGWMQFMPGTWQRYGVAADGQSQPDPYNPRDAIFSAAHYLAASGAAKNLPKAIYSYNHAAWYVVDVMWRAQLITDHMWRAQLIHDHLRVNARMASGGTGQTGLASAETMLVAAWSAVGGPYSQANHDSFGQTAADLRRAGTDCSGFVSWVLDQVDPGFGNQTTVTLPDQTGIQPGVGRYVTMWDRPLPGDLGHVIINILGTWFESGGNTTFNPAGGIAPMSEAQAVGELTGGGFLPYHLTRL
jgi:hypothetical protein